LKASRRSISSTSSRLGPIAARFGVDSAVLDVLGEYPRIRIFSFMLCLPQSVMNLDDTLPQRIILNHGRPDNFSH
jgi:hypothetical protein